MNTTNPDVHSIVLTGDLDVLDQPMFTSELERYVAAAGRAVDVDLSAVTFLGSCGLTFLSQLRRESDQRNTVMTLRAPSPSALRVLHVVGFDTAFRIVPALTSAA